MIRFNLILPLVFITLPGIYAHGQNSCHVMKQAISGTYAGDCKKGLAHGYGLAVGLDRYEGQFRDGLPDGKGIYTWSTGEVYTGQWKAGKRNGIGKYTQFDNGNDSITDGQWVNDQYAGPYYPKPLVKSKEGVDRYTFQKTGGPVNRVMINLYQNGARNSGISGFFISSSSGYESALGEAIGFEGFTLPVTIKVMYSTPNKLNTTTVYVKFEFEIFEPGDWDVDIHN